MKETEHGDVQAGNVSRTLETSGRNANKTPPYSSQARTTTPATESGTEPVGHPNPATPPAEATEESRSVRDDLRRLRLRMKQPLRNGLGSYVDIGEALHEILTAPSVRDMRDRARDLSELLDQWLDYSECTSWPYEKAVKTVHDRRELKTAIHQLCLALIDESLLIEQPFLAGLQQVDLVTVDVVNNTAGAAIETRFVYKPAQVFLDYVAALVTPDRTELIRVDSWHAH